MKALEDIRSTATSDRAAINAVLRRIDKLDGFKAKANFRCCQSCAFYELGQDETLKNVVFYHQQDADAFDQGILTRDLYLAHDGLGAYVAFTMLTIAGFTCEWDGTDSQRLCVKAHV